MNIEKYSERVRGFLQSAQTYALSEGNPQFTAEHVLKVLLDDDQGMASSLIERAGGDPKAARTANDLALSKLPKVTGGNGSGSESNGDQVGGSRVRGRGWSPRGVCRVRSRR